MGESKNALPIKLRFDLKNDVFVLKLPCLFPKSAKGAAKEHL